MDRYLVARFFNIDELGRMPSDHLERLSRKGASSSHCTQYLKTLGSLLGPDTVEKPCQMNWPSIHGSGKWSVSSISFSSSLGSRHEQFALHLIRDGRWREAVFFYREETGVSVAQAEHAIEQMALKHGVHRFSRAFLVTVIAMSGISVMLLAGLVEILS